MQLLKLIALPLVCLSVFASAAQARDRVTVDIRAYDYVAAPVVTHYPNTVYYANTPTVIYYGAPTVVQYVPIVNTRYHNRSFYAPPAVNYYQNWSNGWRGHGHYHGGYRGGDHGGDHGGDRCERR